MYQRDCLKIITYGEKLHNYSHGELESSRGGHDIFKYLFTYNDLINIYSFSTIKFQYGDILCMIMLDHFGTAINNSKIQNVDLWSFLGGEGILCS